MASQAVPTASMYRALTTLADEIDRDLPITMLLVFARVAMAGDEGIDQMEVKDEIKASSGGMSRTVQTLGDVHYLKDKPGLQLITRAFDLRDNRRRLLKLTPKGERLWAKIEALCK